MSVALELKRCFAADVHRELEQELESVHRPQEFHLVAGSGISALPYPFYPFRTTVSVRELSWYALLFQPMLDCHCALGPVY